MATVASHTASAGAAAATIGAFTGTVLGILPPVVTVVVGVFAVAWYCVALWESPTVQSWAKGREFVKLKARQAAAARTLLRAQAATARALRNSQEAEAAALKAAQTVADDALSSSPEP